MGHYGGRGTMAAAMVHRVITVNEGVCSVLWVCCTEDYFHMANTVPGQYLQAVAGKTLANWKTLDWGSKRGEY